MRRLVVLVGACVLLLGGCGDGDSEGAAEEPAVAPSSSSSSTSAATTAASEGYAECIDERGDAPAAVDLVKASLTRMPPGLLTVSYELAGETFPAPDFSSWIVVIDAGSGPALQLGVKVVGSEDPIIYAFDFRTGRQTNLQSARTAGGSRVTGVFPLTVDPALSGDFSWRVVTNDAGTDADGCEGTFPS